MSEPRGAVDITLGGKTYTVRPTFKMIAGIEQATGVGVFALGMKVSQVQCSMQEMAAILFQMLKDQDGPKYEEIGNEIFESGMEDFIVPVSTVLLGAFKGNKALTKAQEVAAKGEDKGGPTTH